MLHPDLASHQLSPSAILSSCLLFSLFLSQFSGKYNRHWQMLNPRFTPYPPLSLFDSLLSPCSLFYWWKFVQQPLTQMLNVVHRTQLSLPLSLSLFLSLSPPLPLSLHLCRVGAKLLLSLNGRSKHSQSLAHESKSSIIIHCIIGWGSPVWRVTNN